MIFVYIIYSPKANLFYKGQCDNLTLRISQHNTGREKFTALYIPWLLIWHTSKGSRALAMDLERKLKNLNRERLIKFMIKYKEGVAGNDEFFLLEKLSSC